MYWQTFYLVIQVKDLIGRKNYLGKKEFPDIKSYFETIKEDQGGESWIERKVMFLENKAGKDLNREERRTA